MFRIRDVWVDAVAASSGETRETGVQEIERERERKKRKKNVYVRNLNSHFGILRCRFSKLLKVTQVDLWNIPIVRIGGRPCKVHMIYKINFLERMLPTPVPKKLLSY